MVTPGHTRAHQVVIVESEGETAIFLGDAAGYAVNLERLAWVPAFDVEPLVSMETKRALARLGLAAERAALLPARSRQSRRPDRADGDDWRVERWNVSENG